MTITWANWLQVSVDLALQIAILSAVIWQCRRHSSAQPHSATWLIRAVKCQFGILVGFCIVNGWYLSLFLQKIEITPELAQPLAFQVIAPLLNLLELATWSLIAWAILMQPDQRRRLALPAESSNR